MARKTEYPTPLQQNETSFTELVTSIKSIGVERIARTARLNYKTVWTYIANEGGSIDSENRILAAIPDALREIEQEEQTNRNKRRQALSNALAALV